MTDGQTLLVLLQVLLFFAVAALAYLKIGLVLALLRSGLGGGGLPSGMITVIVALLFSAVVMAPVAERSLRAMETSSAKQPVFARLAIGIEPVREFLLRHAPPRERASMLELAQRLRPPADRAAVGENDLQVLAPAFALSELRAAFQIGFLLLLPFLVLDLLIASLLAGLPLPGLSVRAVALPFKLLVFVLCDGWTLLMRGLVLGYT